MEDEIIRLGEEKVTRSTGFETLIMNGPPFFTTLFYLTVLFRYKGVLQEHTGQRFMKCNKLKVKLKA